MYIENLDFEALAKTIKLIAKFYYNRQLMYADKRGLSSKTIAFQRLP